MFSRTKQQNAFSPSMNVFVCTNDFVYNGTLISVSLCVCAVEFTWIVIHLACLIVVWSIFVMDKCLSWYFLFAKIIRNIEFFHVRKKIEFNKQNKISNLCICLLLVLFLFVFLINKNNSENFKLICSQMIKT